MPDRIKVFALGGLDENGRDCYIVEINDDIFVLDAGISLPDKNFPGVDCLLPNYDYLVKNKSKIRAYIMTHGHDENIGALPDIIPLLGPILALLLCLALAYPLGICKMFLVLVVYLIAQWCANNLVRPVIFGKFLNLHPLLIILSLLLAAQFLGLWGVILAPAIASVIYELFNELYIKVINKGENDN